MSDLKRCPFCGSPVHIKRDAANGLGDFVCADGAPCRGSKLIVAFPLEHEAVAIEAWNRRAQPAQAGQVLSAAPCDQCGYNGPGYYQPESHSCASGHHKAVAAQAGQVLTDAEVDAAIPHPTTFGQFEPAWNDSDMKILRGTARAIESAVLARVARVPQWIATTDQMPPSGQVVLACYLNELGNVRRIRAQWVAAKTSEADDIDNNSVEYDGETDTYYDPEGWYECIDNWDEYSSVFVRPAVTHWMPLPPPPGIVGEKGGQ